MADKAKLRILAGIAGALLGLTGLTALGVSAALWLQTFMPMPLAVLLCAATFLVLAIAAFWFFLLPDKPAEKEIEQFEEAGATALADLPFDTVKNLFKRHPVATATIAAALGYSLIKDPHSAPRTIQRLLLSLI